MTWARCGKESVVIVGQVRGPGLAMARMHFMESVRPYRPELAVSEGKVLSSQVVTCRIMETASIVPQGTESAVRGLVYPRSDGGFAGIKRARRPGALIKSKWGEAV